MPIPVNHISLLIRQVIDIVLKSRITSYYCLNNHHTICLNNNQQIVNNHLVLNILKNDDLLLVERWIITISDNIYKQQNTIDEIVQFIKNNMQQESLCFTASFDHNSTHCYSHPSLCHHHVEFKSDTQLKVHEFYILSLSVKVLYDDDMFLSWSKMNQSHIHHPDDIIVHPLSPPNHSNHPTISVRRLSRLSLSALESVNTTVNVPKNNSFAIPIPSPRMQYTHHVGDGLRTTIAYSTSPNNNNRLSYDALEQRRSSLTLDHQHHHHYGCLVGSFEESLFSGRMSSMPSKPITFYCQIGVLGYNCKPSLKCPSHWSIVFPASFYNLPQQDDTPATATTPYVGTVDIGEYAATTTTLPKVQPGYRIPPQGQLQVLIKNPNKTAVKLFLIPYDFSDMPKNTNTFLRQKSYEDQKRLRYAIHLKFCRNERGRIYLYKTMRIVFTNRKADANEKFNVICEGPKEPVYIPM